MREDPAPAEAPVPALATAGGAGGSTLAPVDPPMRLPALGLHVRRRLPRAGVTLGPVAGRVAIGVLMLGTLAIVADAAAGPSTLVPRSSQVFPAWESGPLHLLGLPVITSPQAMGYVLSAVLVAMLVAYGAAAAAVRSLSMRTIAIAVLVLSLILLLSPPMQLTDLFNYLGYGRLGALHHLNPYRHVIKQELFDPVYGFSSWHNLRSPYGPLFTALTYPLAFVSLPLAYWVVKAGTVALSLAFVALVSDCARRLGRDPRFAVVLVAFNPIFLIYAIGGFHNDFLMLVPMLGAIALLLRGRDRSAGAVVMLAVAVKFTAVLLLPFLIVGARSRQRRIRVLTGAAAAAVPLIALDLVLFGLSIPNLQQQSTLLTGFSIANVVGLVLGLGGATPTLLKVAVVMVVGVAGHQFLRNRDWPAAAGWTTLALIASLSWLMPWYVVWLLPLAAIASSVALRRAAVILTVYLVLAYMPATSMWMGSHGINLLNTPAGRASSSLQNKLGQ